MEPHSMASQTHAEWSVEQSCPFFLLIFTLNNLKSTFCEQFVNVVYEFKAVYDVITHYEMYPQAVNPVLFDCKSPDFLGIMIFEIQKDISLRTVAANDLNFEDLHLCGFLILELFLFDVSEQALFVGFQ